MFTPQFGYIIHVINFKYRLIISFSVWRYSSWICIGIDVDVCLPPPLPSNGSLSLLYFCFSETGGGITLVGRSGFFSLLVIWSITLFLGDFMASSMLVMFTDDQVELWNSDTHLWSPFVLLCGWCSSRGQGCVWWVSALPPNTDTWR